MGLHDIHIILYSFIHSNSPNMPVSCLLLVFMNDLELFVGR